jgi:hypothetical protein
MMKPKLKSYANGWTVYAEKGAYAGMYAVLIRTAAGEVYDRVRCDDYRMAMDYYKTFCNTARNA